MYPGLLKIDLKLKIEDELETTIEKWDWNAVKNALDDAATKFLTSQENFKESHSLIDGRLVLSTITILFSAYGILDDWLHPFPESRTNLICCVILYPFENFLI